MSDTPHISPFEGIRRIVYHQFYKMQARLLVNLSECWYGGASFQEAFSLRA